VAALARAADLSPRRADRGRRLAAAAHVSAGVTGRLRAASQLLSDARQADPELRRSLPDAVAASCVLLHADGDVDTAHRLLTGAIDSHASDDMLTEALYTLMSVSACGGRAELWEAFHDALARLGPRPPAILRLIGSIIADPAHTTTLDLEQLDAAVQALAGETDPTLIVRIAAASAAVDRTAGCREALWRVVRDGREGGAVTSAIIALTQLSADSFQAGEWEAADRLAAEALGLCQSRGYGLMAWQVRHVQALLAAVRGDHETTRSLTDEVIRWTAPRGARSAQSCSWLARSMAALGRGDFEQAYQQASAVSPAGTLAPHVPFALYCPLDLVEAAARTGRHTEAAVHAKAMREAGIAALSPRLALLAAGSAAVAAGSAALAAPGTSALGLFEEALAIPGADRWPFDLARVQLLYGERLRRSHAMRNSRPQLAAALETFERLGAKPWAVRAASELRATGFTIARPPSDIEAVPLTPQEREIAMFAAAGLTNKQIAERLFMSHRTVGAHLYRIFPKLGVTSRAALRDALGSLPPG
jgi:DNA-binding CsgD family transcriptional regulator